LELSLTQIWHLRNTPTGRSFINMTNNNSPITEPCSIPDVTLCYADLSPFTPICCTLFDRKLSIQATKLEEWSDTWLLRFHPDKCKHMHIGKKNDDNSYSLHRKSLEQVIEEKDIGVVIDWCVRTNALYSCTNVDLSINWKVLRSVANIWFALFTFSLMCFSNVKSESMTTARLGAWTIVICHIYKRSSRDSELWCIFIRRRHQNI
jgi:hypothetical protein